VQIMEKIDRRFQQRMHALDALERSKLALTSASSRPAIGLVEHKSLSASVIQLHYRLHRRRRRLARFRSLNTGGNAAIAARKIVNFFRSVLSRRATPALPPLMRLRAMHRTMPRMSQAMSVQKAAGTQSWGSPPCAVLA
jgi:hypothetical protein